MSNNSGPVRLRIVANLPSAGNGERPTTAIDDVTLTYVTRTFINFNSLNTLTYGVGNGPATQDLTIQGFYLTGGPGSLTITSFNPVFKISSDNINFGSSVTLPYTETGALSTTIKFRLEAALPIGAYLGNWSVRGGGTASNVSYFINGIVTQTPNEPIIIVNPTSLTGTNGFKYNIGSGPIIKSVGVFAANLTGVPGLLTLTSSNPSVFQLIGNDNVRRSTFTTNYDNPNPNVRFPTIVLVEGLAAGEYVGTVVVTGGGAPSVTIPLRGTVTTNSSSGSLSIKPTALAAFSTTQGSPSALQSFTVAGRNFEVGNQLQIDVPAEFEGALFNSPVYSQNPTILSGSGNFDIPMTIRMTGLAGGSFSGDVTVRIGASILTLPVTGTVNPVSTSTQPLSVTVAGYNCQTGALTFGRIGGDPNRAVEYSAIGIKSFSTNPNGVIEAEKRADPNSGTTVLLKARYVGNPASEVTYTFDFGTYCAGQPTPMPTGLQITEPIYNCQTGAITFRTQGGDGTPIEYGAIGIKSFSTNPNGVIEAEKRGDPNSGTTVELKARQSGREVGFVFDFAAYCRSRSARQTAPSETAETLRINVLGNPVGNELTIVVSGMGGRPLQLRLTNVRGHLIEQRNLSVAASTEPQTFTIHQQPPGLLFLQAISGEQRQTVKVMKP